MSKPRPFADSNQTALVIAFPPSVSGLFNTEVHGLVRQVQERLPEVSVSYALTSGTAPTPSDAVAAARFAGSRSSVVVFAGESGDAWPVDFASGGDWMLPASSALTDLDAAAVVEAFNSAMTEAVRAA
jgi:hypothetical protein